MNDTITKDLRIVWVDLGDYRFLNGSWSLLRVEREKYEKSAVYFSTSVFSYYDEKYFYLEQDHDAPRYLESINLNWLDIPELSRKSKITLAPFRTYTTKWDSKSTD
jgi:hypothetical protein